MNVAFSTLVLLLLLLPGIAFRRLYYTGAFSRQYFSEDFGQLLLRVGMLALVIHGGTYLALTWSGSGLAEGYDHLYDLLSGTSAPTTAGGAGGGGLRGRLGLSFVAMQFALVCAGGLLGFVCHNVVIELRLDRAVKLLRFSNYWHYVLRGGLRDFRGVREVLGANRAEIGYTFVDVLVGTSEGDVLYDGVVVDYELRPDNRLDKLVLAQTQRRLFKRDRTSRTVVHPDKRYYRVRGDIVVIPAAEIKNVNVRYVTKIELAAWSGELEVGDADGDVTAMDYYQHPHPRRSPQPRPPEHRNP